jgi:hypothetical protein
MNTSLIRLLLLALLSLASFAALSIDAPTKAPAATKPPVVAPAPAPEAAPPAKPAPADDGKADQPTEAEKKDPEGGFLPPPESDKQIELPPEMRGTADYDISFPIDI